MQDLREMKGELIAKEFGTVRRLDQHTYNVKSQSAEFEYEVMSTELGWICSCPDSMYRGSKCKHIWAVEFSFALRKAVKVDSVVIKPVGLRCKFCGSEHIVKDALRHNKYGDIQRFKCHACGKRFTINLGFEKMHATPQVITSAMQLYFTGESFRSVRDFLKLQGVRFSHQAVYDWVEKYTKIMQDYLDQLTPQVSDKWRTDEMYVKFRGNPKYLFAMMDDETRFRIAQMVSEHKGTSDVRPMFKEARRVAGKKPKLLISDGAQNFQEANTREWRTLKKSTSTRHLRDIRFDGSVHNNKMERQNGEVRDREKVMRGLKKDDTPILAGIQIFHNYFRPHEGLDGKTPAEAAGIKIEGQNKWITIIENASHHPKVDTR